MEFSSMARRKMRRSRGDKPTETEVKGRASALNRVVFSLEREFQFQTTEGWNTPKHSPFAFTSKHPPVHSWDFCSLQDSNLLFIFAERIVEIYTYIVGIIFPLPLHNQDLGMHLDPARQAKRWSAVQLSHRNSSELSSQSVSPSHKSQYSTHFLPSRQANWFSLQEREGGLPARTSWMQKERRRSKRERRINGRCFAIINLNQTFPK